jgi:carbamoylphosphate synthase large subunit
MHVILIAPHFPANQRQFARALKQVGAYVTGIGEWPASGFDSELKSWLDGYEQVSNVCDDEQLLAAVRRIQQRGPWVHRLEATVEAHILSASRVRELTGIPGLTARNAVLCRDKPTMKEFLRENGVATAQSTGADTFEEARKFAERVGYPLIVKPRAGAGASGTSRVDSHEQLLAATREFNLGRGGSCAIEEFIEGHEGFYDTLSIDSHVHLEFVTHYYPGVLEAMRTRNVSPYFITTNRVDLPGYDEVKLMGRKVISAMGLGTTPTHMEWFYGPKGLKFSEIGARPPGVGTWDLYCAANGFDIYRQWAMAVCHGRLDQQPSRQFAAAMVALRPDRDGRIAGYSGFDEVQRRIGHMLIDWHLPPVGHATQPVDAGYMANAWIRLRHPDYDQLREICEWVGRTVRVYAR